MEDQFTEVGPETTLTEIIEVAAFHLLNNGLDGFDFDIPGESSTGSKIVLHFSCKVEAA